MLSQPSHYLRNPFYIKREIRFSHCPWYSLKCGWWKSKVTELLVIGNVSQSDQRIPNRWIVEKQQEFYSPGVNPVLLSRRTNWVCFTLWERRTMIWVVRTLPLCYQWVPAYPSLSSIDLYTKDTQGMIKSDFRVRSH